MVRPEKDAMRDCAHLREQGFLAQPFPISERQIHPAISQIPEGPFRAVIYTSKHAIDSAHLRASTTAFCVGKGTAEAAKEAGFETVFQGPSDGAALADMIGEKCQPEQGDFFWPHGKDIRFDVADALTKRGFRVAEETVYEMRLISALSPDQKSHLQSATSPVCFAVMSLYHLKHLEKLLEQAQIWHDKAKWHLLVLTKEMAEAAAPRWHDVSFCHQANRDAMLTLITDLLTQLETTNSPHES